MDIISRPKRPQPKPLIWTGSAKKDLCALPGEVIDVFGYALYLAQCGKRHESTKVLRGFGDASVLEVIESKAGSAYRAAYTVRFADAVSSCTCSRRNQSRELRLPNPTWI